MFSRFFKSARNLVYSDPLNEEASQTQVDPAQSVKEAQMVLTRRGGKSPVGDDLDEDDTINVYVPQTPKRKLNSISRLQNEEDEKFYTPPTSKKARLSKQKANAEEERLMSATRPVVLIPAMIPPPADNTQDIEELEESEERRKIKDPLPVRTRNGVSEALDSGKIQYPDLGDIEDDDAVSGDGNERTNDDMAVDQQLEADKAEDETHPEEELEEETSDVQEPAVDINPEEELVEGTIDAQGLAMHMKSMANTADVPPELFQADNGRKSSTASKSRTTDTLVASSLQGSKLPEFLPAEFFEDEEAPSRMETEEVGPQKRATKTKFADEVLSTPKDRRVGSTTYRVSKPTSSQLAPKASPHSRSMKESWLQGRSGRDGVTHRKAFSSGFFVKK